MNAETNDVFSPKKKKRSRGTRGGGSRRRKDQDRCEPKSQQRNGHHLRQYARYNSESSSNFNNLADPPLLVQSSSSSSSGSTSNGSLSNKTNHEEIGFASLMEFPCLPPITTRSDNALTAKLTQQTSTISILPSKDAAIESNESSQIGHYMKKEVLDPCTNSLGWTQRQHEYPEQCKGNNHFHFNNVMSRIKKQRQMLPKGGSLFEISPRTFLMGKPKK